MPFINYREGSKLSWGITKEKSLTIEEITLGCMLRIADSLEKMEEPYTELLQIIENYKDLEIENKKLKKTISGLKGYITKLNSPNKQSL